LSNDGKNFSIYDFSFSMHNRTSLPRLFPAANPQLNLPRELKLLVLRGRR
jgi:hypothetical protein